jgi:glycosyltransferase involved in cell wall biosynthesis
VTDAVDEPPVRSPLISIVAPAFNEVETLREFHARVSAALATEDHELVFVDDGSTDGTGPLIARLARDDPRVRPVFLSRNFGHQAAVTAGIDAARGDVVVSIDADLQDPPEVIPQLLAAWRDGADVVHAVRHARPGETRLRLAAIRGFYRLFTRIGGLQDFPGNTGDFRLVAGPALEALRALPESNRFVRGLVSWLGFRQTSVVYERDPRFAGASKYPLRKLLHLGLDGVISFSTLPLQLATLLGLCFSAVAFLAIPVIVVLKLAGLYDVSGIASVHVLILLIGGVQLVFLGVIGEYLGRTYDEGKRRPIYLTSPRPRSAEPADGD